MDEPGLWRRGTIDMAFAESLGADLDSAWPGQIDTREDAGTKPIDLTYLRRFTLGNRELETEVLDLFAEAAPGYLRALDRATNDKDWNAAAHTLKGSARAVGAWRVARMAEVAEKVGFVADRDRRDFAIDNAAEALAEALAFASDLKRG